MAGAYHKVYNKSPQNSIFLCSVTETAIGYAIGLSFFSLNPVSFLSFCPCSVSPKLHSELMRIPFGKK